MGTQIYARALLAAPPFVVTGFYVLAIGVPFYLERALPGGLPAPVSALLDYAFWICAVVWAFALFTVIQAAAPTPARRIGAAIFVATLGLFAVAIVLQILFGPPVQVMLTPSGAPLFALMSAPVFGAVISLGFAASALDAFEGGDGSPFKAAAVTTWFALFLLPLGVWLLNGRVRKLLAQHSA